MANKEKIWSSGTNWRLPFDVNVLLNLSNCKCQSSNYLNR